MVPLTFADRVLSSCLLIYDGWNLVLALLVSTMLEETRYNVMPQPALSCDVRKVTFECEVVSGLQYGDE